MMIYSPTLLSWDESLSTGDRDLDTQHRYLIEICNDLATAIEKKHDPKITGMVLDVLMFYAESHFKKEEECMQRYHCAAAERNQKAHGDFLDTLKAYQSEHEACQSPFELAIRIHQYLTTWVTGHIAHVDTQLHSAIHQEQDPGSG